MAEMSSVRTGIEPLFPFNPRIGQRFTFAGAEFKFDGICWCRLDTEIEIFKPAYPSVKIRQHDSHVIKWRFIVRKLNKIIDVPSIP